MCNYACANVMLQLSESFLLMQILHEDIIYIYIYIYNYGSGTLDKCSTYYYDN